MATEVNSNTSVAMPIRNLISIVGAVAVGTWAYFGVVERLNKLETNGQLMQSDLEKNNEFRIKTPQSPTDKEQYMLIEHLAGELEKLQTDIESGKAPYDQQQKLTLEFYEKRITNLEENIEKLRNGDG